MDARKLADLLRTGMPRPVYHGEHGLRTLRELARTYQTLSQDLNRVMNRLKALYRGWGVACGGTQVYAPRYREEWLGKIEHVGVRRRAELLYQQLGGLQALRRTLRSELLAESRKHKAAKLLRQIPCIGPIRAARLLALPRLLTNPRVVLISSVRAATNASRARSSTKSWRPSRCGAASGTATVDPLARTGPACWHQSDHSYACSVLTLPSVAGWPPAPRAHTRR